MSVITSRQHPMVKQCRAILRGDDERLLLDGWHLARRRARRGLPDCLGRSGHEPRGDRARRLVGAPLPPAPASCRSPASRPGRDVAGSLRLGRGRRRASVQPSIRARCWPPPQRWCSPPSASRIPATSAPSSGRPMPPVRTGVLLDEPGRRPVELEGAARVDGQRLSAAGAARGMRPSTTFAPGRSTASASSPPTPATARSMYDLALTGPLVLVLGGEGAGLPAAVLEPWPMPGSACRCGRGSNRSTSRWPRRCSSTRRRASAPSVTMGLFDEPASLSIRAPSPSPERMRPRTLDEVVGQDEVIGPGPPAARDDRARPAAVDHPVGPARHRQDHARQAHRRSSPTRSSSPSARCSSGIKEVKEVMAAAELRRRRLGSRTIVFVDEIHRFNKAQQDAFLPRVEAGDIVLIGATTENPSFEVNAALLSRSKVFVLKPLDEAAIITILRRALEDEERGLGLQHPHAIATRYWRTSRASPTATPRGRLNLLAAPGRLGAAAGGQPRHRHGAARTDAAAQGAALRQGRRGALQPDLGPAQVDAQQRSRRRRVLAGPHGRGRRGPDVHRAADRAVCLRRHRQRRPAGAGRRRGRAGMPRTSSAARRPTPRWPRPPSTWPPPRRATRSTPPTAQAAESAQRDVASPGARCTCGTPRRG